ncbi:hypothetical protein [Geobacillus kaustophilus]|uniref:hypothetical protein n=1 Tax=Geobacillus kaustophilus TaxID=1462 RepID=UPI00387E2043
MSFIVDGNPIYLLAQHFFAQHGISFDVRQVIGLTNEDPVSEEFRPLKQIIERFSRTFKGNCRPTHGFSAEEDSVSFVTLFVAYFNFLRPHSALESRVPVVIPELAELPHMPARWTKLIAMAQAFSNKRRPNFFCHPEPVEERICRIQRSESLINRTPPKVKFGKGKGGFPMPSFLSPSPLTSLSHLLAGVGQGRIRLSTCLSTCPTMLNGMVCVEFS